MIDKRNPKDVVGSAKPPLSCIPANVLMETAVAMHEGARKYGRHNWRDTPVTASIYYDGTMRHLMAWHEGEDIDPYSGVSHVTKAIASLIVLRDAMLQDMWDDDRPIAAKKDWMLGLEYEMAEVIHKYPEEKAPFTENGRQDTERGATEGEAPVGYHRSREWSKDYDTPLTRATFLLPRGENGSN